MRVVEEGPPAGAAPGAPALVLPGRGYDVDRPVLRAVRDELVAAGRRVLALSWTEGPPAPEDVPALARFLLDDLRPCLVVAKSLTTLALPVAADRGVAGIWLTPLLDHPEVGLAAARSHPRTLLVGGTGDPTWDRTLAHESDREVLELDGADHSLEHPGDPARTAADLDRLRRRVREFLAG
ncbi:alpha/beta hydrolase [Kineococcus sp. LSe6-4]|uniref:Alpha/beta hydrolase n=1 Tax=Kineococcus halophytocola TaxID=3234027 RepID=A0ABV4H6E3_9ACTN